MNGTADPEITLRNAITNASRQVEAYLNRVHDSIQEVNLAYAAYETHLKNMRQQLDIERQEIMDQRMQLEHDKTSLAFDMESMENLNELPRGGGDSAGARGYSRSRSPKRRLVNDVHDEISQACERLHLDETASRHLENFPPEEALNMLNQVNSDIRNPSAFITKLCQRMAQQQSAQQQSLVSPPPELSGSERVEAAIQEIGLDETAARGLREMPPDQAMQMLDQVDKSVRNPSAFIMSLYNKGYNRANRGGKGRHSDGRSSHEEEDRSSQRWGGSQTSGNSGSDALSKEALVDSMAAIARKMELDEACMTALASIEPSDALVILQRLAQDIQNGSLIRNRSAFVRAEVKKRTSHTSGRSSSVSSGPASSVPCKFWAEGRCKNGSDCRFSHDG